MYWIIKQISHHLYWHFFILHNTWYIFTSQFQDDESVLFNDEFPKIFWYYTVISAITIYSINIFLYDNLVQSSSTVGGKIEKENLWIPPLSWGKEAVAGRRCHLSHVRLVRAPIESPDKILCWELLLPRYKGWTCDYPDNREDVRIISWYSNSANFPAAEVAYLL